MRIFDSLKMFDNNQSYLYLFSHIIYLMIKTLISKYLIRSLLLSVFFFFYLSVIICYHGFIISSISVQYK